MFPKYVTPKFATPLDLKYVTVKGWVNYESNPKAIEESKLSLNECEVIRGEIMESLRESDLDNHINLTKSVSKMDHKVTLHNSSLWFVDDTAMDHTFAVLKHLREGAEEPPSEAQMDAKFGPNRKRLTNAVGKFWS